MRRVLSLMIIFMIVFLTFPGEKRSLQAQPSQPVQFSIFHDKDSFTIYIPGNQPVSLDGLRFQFIDAYRKIVQRAIQDYRQFLDLPFDALPAPMCLVLMRHNMDDPLPTQCSDINPTHVIQQDVANADVFWYDRITAQIRKIEIFLGSSYVGSCPGNLDECAFPSEASVIPSPAISSRTLTFTVESRQEANDPHLHLSKGQTVTIKYLNGKWRAGDLPTWPYHGPAGDPQTPSKVTFPVPNAPVMALIAGIDDLPFIAIGRVRTFQVPIDGNLWLAANDDDYADNDGSLTVQIIVYDAMSK